MKSEDYQSYAEIKQRKKDNPPPKKKPKSFNLIAKRRGYTDQVLEENTTWVICNCAMVQKKSESNYFGWSFKIVPNY